MTDGAGLLFLFSGGITVGAVIFAWGMTRDFPHLLTLVAAVTLVVDYFCGSGKLNWGDLQFMTAFAPLFMTLGIAVQACLHVRAVDQRRMKSYK